MAGNCIIISAYIKALTKRVAENESAKRGGDGESPYRSKFSENHFRAVIQKVLIGRLS